jgi:hypothetical protein
MWTPSLGFFTGENFAKKRELKFFKSKMKLFWRVLIPGSEKKN